MEKEKKKENGVVGVEVAEPDRSTEAADSERDRKKKNETNFFVPLITYFAVLIIFVTIEGISIPNQNRLLIYAMIWLWIIIASRMGKWLRKLTIELAKTTAALSILIALTIGLAAMINWALAQDWSPLTSAITALHQ